MADLTKTLNCQPQRTAGKPGVEEYRLAVAKTILERYGLKEVRGKSIENLSRWKSQGTWSTYYEQWMKLMRDGSDEEVIAAMTSTDEKMSRLRGSPPYPGLLDENTVESLRLKYRGK